jgi:hypothetical protein
MATIVIKFDNKSGNMFQVAASDTMFDVAIEPYRLLGPDFIKGIYFACQPQSSSL